MKTRILTFLAFAIPLIAAGIAYKNVVEFRDVKYEALRCEQQVETYEATLGVLDKQLKRIEDKVDIVLMEKEVTNVQ